MESDESSPPAVPPKDPGYKPIMDNSVSRPASGSKRKRELQDDTVYDVRDGRLEPADLDFTPTKKARSNAGTSEGYATNDDTPLQRSVRRKKGTNNLSRLNLRHAASMSSVPQQRHESPTRESKFQEGSLNDKPSEKPPSVYTRFQRTDSGTLEHVDQLMTDYHEGMPTPAGSAKAALDYEKATMPQRVEDIHARQKKEEGGMYRFGKSIAAAFHPVSLWNRLWSEQKDELAGHDLGHGTAEEERKAKVKEDVEARYAQMKATGQFSFQPVSLQTPHDSAIALTGPFSAQERERTTSFGSMLRQSQETPALRDHSEVPESATKTLRGMRSRLHLRKPSLQNLKNGITGGLKRVASDMNLTGAVDRESSSSVSPVKPEFGSALRQSQSRQDLKRQKRLSKRVSDLESKLNRARSELDEALVAASPMPKLGGQYERFTPVGTVRRPKFVPGALATLPSEGVLFPEQAGSNGLDQGARKSAFSRPRRALDLSKAFDDIDDEEEDDEETVKASRGRPYPVTAKDMFNGSQQDNGKQESHEEPVKERTPAVEPTSELTEFTEVPDVKSDDIEELPAVEEFSPFQGPSKDETPAPAKNGGGKVKIARKPVKSKKRSNMEGDRTFNPKSNGQDDDDAEWDEAVQQPKKKRKSTGKADSTQQTKQAAAPPKPKSPTGKAIKNAGIKTAAIKFSPPQSGKKAKQQASMSDLGVDSVVEAESEDELTKAASARSSLLSNAESLEPLYEEEEETTTIPLKDEPSKPTAKATPARFGRDAVRVSSLEKVEVIIEEKIMTRAAEAAQQRRGSRSSSPIPAKVDEKLTIVPGEGDVPALPGKRDAAKIEVTKHGMRNGSKENFEWPDDVF